MKNFNIKKATQVINFFCIKEGNEIDKLKLIKLIWLSDRYHLRKYGRFITDDIYFAMPQGPVPSSILDLIDTNIFTYEESELEYSKSFILLLNKTTVKSIAPLNEIFFSKTDLDVMEEIYSIYNKYSGKFLSEISHSFPEWVRHKEDIKNGVRRKTILLEDFFKNIDEEISFPIMNLEEDHLSLSKEFFLEMC